MVPDAAGAQAGAALAALGAAGVLTEVMRRLALRHSLVDQVSDHKAHGRPTPYLGGAAIVLSTLIAVELYLPRWRVALVVLMLCAVGVAVLGLFDDVSPLSPRIRLQVEAALAMLVVLGGVRLAIFGGALGTVVTVVWIVFITNCFNLLDNTDGAAATVSAATAACLAVAAFAENIPDSAIVLIALSAACSGFLVHNWAPARIFMGDCGSLFIGFVIATMSVLVPSYQGGVRSVVGTALFAFVPAVDTSVVVISRRRAGRPLLLGGTDHVAHRLRRLGLSVGQVGLALLAASGGVSFAGVLVTCRTLPAVPTLVAVILAALISVAVMLRIPAYEQGTAQDHTIPVPKLTRHAPHTDLSSANAFASLPIHSGTRPPQPETVEHREPA